MTINVNSEVFHKFIKEINLEKCTKIPPPVIAIEISLGE